MKSRLATAIVSGALTLGLTACGGGGKSGDSAGNTAPAEKAAATPGPAAAGTGGAEFGVPECDEYIAKYTACIDSKVPESARVMIRQQLDATKASWKQAASTPEGRAGLSMGCKQAIEAAKTALQAYGCSW